MPVLAVRTPEDGLLGALAPLGLGAAAGTALVVDLDPSGPSYPGAGSLASLVEDGPRRSDLSPDRSGLAVLRNGGIDPDGADEVVASLAAGRPSVVLRLPASGKRRADIVVRPLVPGGLFPTGEATAAVFQDLGFRLPAPGPVLPVLSRGTAAALLAGSIPMRSRWVRAWKAAWEGAWA
ncbi:MAG: hypothetical protein KJP22_06340 [Acidimicrobiia bacterium]|nr:hypothetical protein [Acidimicrobiia bacterium]